MSRSLAILGGLAITVSGLSAQDVKQIRLDQPTRSFPEPFSSVSGLRQLDDGRLVVSDRLEQAVRFLDLTDGSMEDIGRVGGGPGEYQMPTGLFPLPGDSTMLVIVAKYGTPSSSEATERVGSCPMICTSERSQALLIRPRLRHDPPRSLDTYRFSVPA